MCVCVSMHRCEFYLHYYVLIIINLFMKCSCQSQCIHECWQKKVLPYVGAFVFMSRTHIYINVHIYICALTALKNLECATNDTQFMFKSSASTFP